MLSCRDFFCAPSAAAPSPALPATTRLLLLCVVGAWCVFWLIGITGPSDLADHDHQERQASYVLDVLVNGNWACQQDQNGELCGKPPLYTWLAAGLSLPFGRISRVSLFLPGAAAVLGMMLTIWYLGRRYFGPWAGAFGALALLLSPSGTRMLDMARIDGLFACTVFLAAALAFAAWQSGRGWTWFWLAAAAATLAKGPLGLVLAAGGLFAHLWERRGHPDMRLRGSHWIGVVLFFLFTLGWFLLAYHTKGPALLDRMLGSELIHEAVKAKRDYFSFTKPTICILTRFLPWSVLVILAVWRAFRHPATDTGERRLERFLVCYFLFGLVLFSLGAHQRPDLVFPLLPAAALLAGRELARWLQPETQPHLLRWLAVALAAGAVGFGLYTHVFHRVDRDKDMFRTRGVRELATRFEREFGKDYPLLICKDAPVTFQVFLNTFRPHVSYEEAARRLAAPEPVLVLVANPVELRKLLPGDAACHEVMRWPATGEVWLALLGNRAPPAAAAQ